MPQNATETAFDCVGFKERLVQFARAQYDMGQNYFEKYCGINWGTISSIKVKGPSAEIITKISFKCPELNLNWLFRGEEGGAMLNTPREVEPATAPVNVENVQAVFITNWKDIQGAVEETIKKALIK